MRSELVNIVNVENVAEIVVEDGEHWNSTYKPLTPALMPSAGRLGVNLTRVPPGQSACPFHAHQIEDEVFFVMSGRGVFRYGEALREVRAGDCISCPAGLGTAHQLANPFDEDLLYLAIGMNDPNEVATYPDSGKIMVRSLGLVGRMQMADYYDGEPVPPRIFTLIAEREAG
ncbi:cupin domain-containing protein [Lichenicoccus sp.]|uniref:cupin domain-containing protein n=1 Tax=Lichenicoccus sp. TaxID=2781899 RepID=UPI003D132A74